MNVEIEKDYPQEAPLVKGDSNMLQQVFFNLFVNALDAMPTGGKLKIRMPLDKKAERKVRIEVEDTGSGIPQNELTRVFEPFFTTKKPRSGTGLGLSVVHLILERHSGKIEVESVVNKGTKFTVELLAEE